MNALEARIAATIKRGLPFMTDTTAQLGAADIIADLHLYAETVHVEGEWGFGARDEVRIRGYLT